MNGLNENVVKTALIAASFAVAIFLGAWLSPVWLLLLAIPLFGIPLLRELRALHDADERETWDHYRGSHLAFYAVMLYVAVAVTIRWANGWPTSYELMTILYIAFTVKLLFGVATVLDQRLAAVLLMAIYGVIWLLVSIPAGHSLVTITFYSAGGAAVLLVAALGWRFPLPGGIALALLSVGFLFYPFNIFLFRTPIEGHLWAVTLIVAPPLVAGWMLINSYLSQRREAPASEPQEVAS